MRTITLFCLLLVLVVGVQAQRKKKETLPVATPASARWEGYQQRLKLIEQSLVKNVPFRNVGPTVMSGRVVDLAVDPDNPNHFYVAYASGSLWETTNNGTSFAPLFDNEIVMSIGDIAVDWKNDVIYIGTGENNSSRSSYSGYGLYKSSNNGKSWEHLGLEESHHIGRIIIHPENPAVLWVGALGHLYSENPERGIYKTTDGGRSWKKALFVNNRTGVIDLDIHPSNPDILIAATWERDRKAWNFTEAGHGTSMYRTADGGRTWEAIDSSSGFPGTEGTGRIGLSFAPSNGNIVYAILDNQDRRPKKDEDEVKGLAKDKLRSMTTESFLALENKDINAFLDANQFPDTYNAVDIKSDVKNGKVKPLDLVTYLESANALLFDTPVKGGEMYRSDDGGKTWKKTREDPIESMVFSYGYYFGQVRVDAQDPNVVYTMGVPIVRSDDAGKTWKSINEGNVHVDHHALWINPEVPSHIVLGNDGGVYISYDTGATWTNCNSPAVGQFYAINADMASPYNVYGGLQDNGVWRGPGNYEYSRDWLAKGQYPYKRLIGGDGMQVAVDTRDNNTVYTGYQFGNYFRVDASTGDTRYITPKHKLGEVPFRWNWQAPIQLSGHNQDIVYFGSNRFHRSMNKGESFETLSGDLTNGGKKGDVSYGTLTTISESTLRFGLIYVGSDDGVVQVSKNVGASWERVSSDLPKDLWVSRVAASNHKEERVYAALNGYRWDDFTAYIYQSDDYGKTWTRIGTDLPVEPVNVIKEDPKDENILYVGTDHGVYVSINRGKTFMAMKGGLPAVAVHDLMIHPRDNELIVGTHGRSIYIAAIEPLQKLPQLTSSTLHIFPVGPIAFNDKWGSKTRDWGDLIEAKADVVFYSNSAGKAKVEVIYKDKPVVSREIDAGKGLNYLDLALETDERFKELLDEGAKEEYKAAPNGDYHLVAGDYILKVTVNEHSLTLPFTIEGPDERPGRKE